MTIEITNAGLIDYEQLHIGWFLVDWCNYNCSYCSAAEIMRKSYSKNESNSLFKLTLKRLSKLTTPFDIDIYGGEPTLHPNFNEILEELSAMPNCSLIEVKTNLSRSLAFYQKMHTHAKLRLSASYHPEHHSQEFIDKCIALKSDNFYCHISMSDDPIHWPQTLELIETLVQHGISYDFNMLFSTAGNTIEYTDEFYKTFNKISQTVDNPKYRYQYNDGTVKWIDTVEIYKTQLDSFTGFRCSALMYEINIHGDISNMCTGRTLPLLIKRENTHVPSICPLTSCNCDVMFNFYKENMNNDN